MTARCNEPILHATKVSAIKPIVARLLGGTRKMNQHRNRFNMFPPIFVLGVAGCSPLALGQSPGTFTATGSMATARRLHTATLLMDGRVLIAGGENESPRDTPLFTTEIYDPVKQTFTPSANMMTGRSGHTATLLPDGRVLIAGGDSIVLSSPGNGSAELYDPSTGSFTATGSLLMARLGFNATLLANGKVLITGGVAGALSGNVVGDAEIYDPSTGSFTAAGAYAGSLAILTIAISGFASTSTLLPDGMVLWATEPAAQVYDPVTAAFSLRGTMLVNLPF
jgi:hypothetical protein